jgi:integrase
MACLFGQLFSSVKRRLRNHQIANARLGLEKVAICGGIWGRKSDRFSNGAERTRVGIYRRKCGMFWICYTAGGKQRYESTGTHDRKLAKKILAMRLAEIAEGKWNLPASNPPRFKDWATQFLLSIRHPSTKTRYQLSVNQLLSFFGEDSRLPDVASVRRVEEFKAKRLASGVMSSTANRHLSVLRRMLTLAARQRLIARNPFIEVELLEERKDRRRPHILSYEGQEKLIATATPHLRALIILLTETGLRVNKEAFQLKWTDIDFDKSLVTVRDSKTLAGRRSVPLSELCKAEMLIWKKLKGPEFSDWVFQNPKTPSKPLKSVRKTWLTALKNAGLPSFPIYNLRHCFATRLSAAGASPMTIADLLGHSSLQVVQTYAKVLVDARRDGIKKLEQLRQSHESRSTESQVEPTLQ